MNQHVYICGCKNHGKIEKSAVEELKQQLRSRDIGFIYIEDLCGTLDKNPKDLEIQTNSLVFGCYPRAMNKLFENLLPAFEDSKPKYYHIGSEEAVAAIESISSKDQKEKTIEYKYDWKAWYPVIDYERCNGCQKCLNFCLFGVYEKNKEGKVIVAEPSNCKDLCPACARICTLEAIIFPKHKDGPIDGSKGESQATEGINILEQIQNDDVYSVLSARRSTFKTSLLKKNQFSLAQEERRECSCKSKIGETGKKDKDSETGCC